MTPTSRPPPRRALGRGLLCAGALAFVAAAWCLARRSAAADGRELCLCVLDASASVRRTRPAWLPWARGVLSEEARRAAEAAHDFAVLSFAAGVGFSFPPGSPADFQALLGGTGRAFDPRDGAGADGRSRLADALEVARGTFARTRAARGTLVVIGDARFDGVDPGAALAELRANGVDVRLVPPPPPSVAELGVRSLALDEALEAGAPLVARVELFFAPGAGPTPGAALELELEDARGTSRRVLDLGLSGPSASFVVGAELGPAQPGRTAVRVRARLATGPDPIPEDDQASAALRTRGALVLAVLADAGRLDEERERLAPAGRAPFAGLQLVFGTPEQGASLLAQADGVATLDLAAERLPAVPLRAFVEGGGGWLALAGWSFLGAWGKGTEPRVLEELLPLVPDPGDGTPRDVLLLVDGSGSMEGEPFEQVRGAARELFGFARPEDEVRVRFFTARLEPALVLAERGAAREASGAALERLLALRSPRGETRILDALEELARERAGEASRGLVFLLSDGREGGAADAERAARAERVRQAFEASRTRLCVVAAGTDPDVAFLATLLEPGEAPERPGDRAALAQVFRREASRELWKEGAPLRARTVAGPSGSLVGEAFPGAAFDLPPLRRMLRARLRPAAEAAWVDEDGDPLLGVARAGLGRVALFASGLDAGWADAWRGADAAPLAGVLRWIARGPTREAQAVQLAREGQALRLRGPAGLPPELSGAVLDARGEALAPPVALAFALPWSLRAPGDRGVRDGALPAAPLGSGPHLVRLDPPLDATFLPLPELLPAEFDPSSRACPAEAFGPRTADGQGGGGGAAPLLAGALLAAGLLLAFLGGACLSRPVGHQAPDPSDR